MNKNVFARILERLGEPQVASGSRGLIVIAIFFKVVTVQQRLRNPESALAIGADTVASVLFVLALTVLALLFWRKYRKPKNSSQDSSREQD